MFDMKASGDFSIGSNVWPGTSKLLEEMGELRRVLGKLIATAGETTHWDGWDLRDRLVEEAADVAAALMFFQAMNLSTDELARLDRRMVEKVRLFNGWHMDQEKKS